MLVSEKPLELMGFLSAVETAGFIVPLFGTRTSNMLLVQEIGNDDRVTNFREVDPRGVTRLEGTGQLLSIGDLALWGFRDFDGRPLIMDRKQLQDVLHAKIDSIRLPFLKLQVSQFCEDQQELMVSWRNAFEHLEERSPKSAEAWRDVVIVPAQMRLAVEHAILANGLDASVEHLNRTVEVDVDRGSLLLRLSPELHAALTENENARAAFERSAAPVKEAFRLSRRDVTLVAKEAGPGQASDTESLSDEVAIAGFGNMAISLLNQVFPRVRRGRYPDTSYYLGRPAPTDMVLLQEDEMTGTSDWGAGTEIAKLNPRNQVLLVVFQLSAELSHVADHAIKFASAHASRGRQIIAIIPHLPSEFDEPAELANSVVPRLHKHFDGVWSLSDRSPYTRQSLPFGPARSVQAAATHFRYLLGLAVTEDGRRQLRSMKSQSQTIDLVGSATGDQPTTKLIEHAMGRLAHYLFDLRPVTAARVITFSHEDPFDVVVQEMIHRDAPHAKVSLGRIPKTSGGADRVTVALKNVGLREGGSEDFERYCIEQLRRFGWEQVQSLSAGSFEVSYGDNDGLRVDCKYVDTTIASSALRARQRRHHLEDRIMLTNGMIRRRAFAVHVLNGVVPVHSSRIDALQRIYRRRYGYCLTILHQEQSAAARIVTPAALDFINMHPRVRGTDLGKAKLLPGARVELAFAPRLIGLTLPIELRGKSRSALPVVAHADLTLDESGWHLKHLAIEGSGTA